MGLKGYDVGKFIWVVEQGSYSDYKVVGVFTTEKNAKLIADKLNSSAYSDEATIAQWPLDPAVNQLIKGYRQFTVVMLRDGMTERCDELPFSSYELAGKFWIWKRTEAPAYVGKGIPDALQATMLAKNAKHAIKIANEHRTQMIANGEW